MQSIDARVGGKGRVIPGVRALANAAQVITGRDFPLIAGIAPRANADRVLIIDRAPTPHTVGPG